jgi:uncharacterized protein YqeY
VAAKEQAEIAVIEAYLPRAATREEIEAAVVAAMAETGASTLKEMGAVMRARRRVSPGARPTGAW